MTITKRIYIDCFIINEFTVITVADCFLQYKSVPAKITYARIKTPLWHTNGGIYNGLNQTKLSHKSITPDNGSRKWTHKTYFFIHFKILFCTTACES